MKRERKIKKNKHKDAPRETPTAGNLNTMGLDGGGESALGGGAETALAGAGVYLWAIVCGLEITSGCLSACGCAVVLFSLAFDFSAGSEEAKLAEMRIGGSLAGCSGEFAFFLFATGESPVVLLDTLLLFPFPSSSKSSATSLSNFINFLDLLSRSDKFSIFFCTKILSFAARRVERMKITNCCGDFFKNIENLGH